MREAMHTTQILPGMESTQTISGSELAAWFGVTPAAITKMVADGRIAKAEDGKYPLKASVQSYIRELKARKSHSGGESKDLDRSLKFWTVEGKKSKVVSWRMQYGRAIASQIVGQLQSSIQAFRLMIQEQADMRVNAAILNMLDQLKGVDIDDAVYSVESEEEDLDDDEGEIATN